MEIRKSVINGQILDVYKFDEYAKNPQAYDSNTAILDNGYIYPIKKPGNSGVGMYIAGPKATMVVFEQPQTQNEINTYSDSNLIDFTDNNMRELIENTEILFEKEKDILTNINNVFIQPIKEDDSPAMQAIKEAINNKTVDFDSYKHRFGSNSNNTKKLFENNDMTLKKIGYVAKGFDLKVTLTIEDAAPNVANPMGEPIVKVITGDED